jgi:hypothetical protein
VAGESHSGSRSEILLAEHAGVLEKIRHASTDLYRTETVVPLAIAAIYAWLYGSSGMVPRQAPDFFWMLPVLLAVFGAWRQWLRYAALNGYAEYHRKIESDLYREMETGRGDWACSGFEHYWVKIHPLWGWGRLRMRSHAWMRSLFWGLLIVLTSYLSTRQTVVSPTIPAVQAAVRPASGGSRTSVLWSGTSLIDWAVISGVAVPIIILALTFLVQARNTSRAARENHRTKMIELAIDTANREFAHDVAKPESAMRLPMSAYVIFHMLLFERLERVGPHYQARQALKETLSEVKKIFPVYRESKLLAYRGYQFGDEDPAEPATRSPDTEAQAPSSSAGRGDLSGQS